MVSMSSLENVILKFTSYVQVDFTEEAYGSSPTCGSVGLLGLDVSRIVQFRRPNNGVLVGTIPYNSMYV